MGAFSSNLGVGVYVTDAYSVGPDVKDLVAFLKAGGGVLIAGQAWNWAANHPKENVLLHVGQEFEEDLECLLQGVSEFDLHDTSSSELLVHGPLAFPIGTTEDGGAFLGGSYYGQGRVIVITHEALLKTKTLASFLKNAINWLDQGRKGIVGVVPELKLPNESGLKSEETKFRTDLSVFVCTVYKDDSMEEIQNFVAEGGGLLIGGHAWHWSYTHVGQNPMTDFSGNKILNKMGLSVLVTINEPGSYKPSLAKKDTNHFRHLLHRFAGQVTQGEEPTKHDEKKLNILTTNFLNMKAYDSYTYTLVLSILTDVLKSSMPQVSEKNPVKSPKGRLLLSLWTAVYNTSPDPDALLPNLIKDIIPLTVKNHQSIMINTHTAGQIEWISTGLYLPPGMKTEIFVPANIVNKSWTIQIGCQTDILKADELKRAPSVCEQFPVTTKKIQVWNLWGGLIYLVAPPNTKVEGAEVIVQMAVLAPYYKSGVTTAADWSMLRTAPSPWAELEFDNVILTVPSDVVRDLKHIDKVAALWNDIMKGVADLAVMPHKFARKERFVADVQISAGWMHSGYPVMIHTESANELVRPGDARTKGLWGEIHELGHNQQRACWEFPPHTTDCTCNLWSVYVHEEVLGLKREKAHPSMTSTERKRCVEEYVEGGRKLSNWTVWVALETYLQLQRKFGWDAFKKVFAAYHKITDYPSDNNGKMNLYAETFSQAVGMNLAGFFKAWGWPINGATEEKLSNLPPWSDHPMHTYK
ncbi:hypothetical protein FQN60_004628 [Etheostoma spectabile]|uniref:Peptidase M60 domain-containing protein n=1 Tax=Etheostoma spectabile TaxID=54343 RepID=A0A5J5DKB9_9PERO|nr:hypothetical protein FQN60_004628 [Etheostoma spectabile]